MTNFNYLICDTCHNLEGAPYDEGDKCICGGKFVRGEKYIKSLERTIADHEEDSAALPENMSITETVKMKDNKIAKLERDLAITQKALELAVYYFAEFPKSSEFPESFITKATIEIDKESGQDE